MLSIGLVVDDAIVVLENIQRRADLGEPPPLAALRGTRQVAFAVMATTAVLVAVFNGDGSYVINPDKEHTLDAEHDVLIITCSLSHMAFSEPAPRTSRRGRPRATPGPRSPRRRAASA